MNNKGLTLIELLILIAIISILATVVITMVQTKKIVKPDAVWTCYKDGTLVENVSVKIN